MVVQMTRSSEPTTNAHAIVSSLYKGVHINCDWVDLEIELLI